MEQVLSDSHHREALVKAGFIRRMGEIRDRSVQQQRYRVSGLNLTTAVIVLWNTVHLKVAGETSDKLAQNIRSAWHSHALPR
jgi:TnpA family transposase